MERVQCKKKVKREPMTKLKIAGYNRQAKNVGVTKKFTINRNARSSCKLKIFSKIRTNVSTSKNAQSGRPYNS